MSTACSNRRGDAGHGSLSCKKEVVASTLQLHVQCGLLTSRGKWQEDNSMFSVVFVS